jgi:hypothetical protein
LSEASFTCASVGDDSGEPKTCEPEGIGGFERFPLLPLKKLKVEINQLEG